MIGSLQYSHTSTYHDTNKTHSFQEMHARPWPRIFSLSCMALSARELWYHSYYIQEWSMDTNHSFNHYKQNYSLNMYSKQINFLKFYYYIFMKSVFFLPNYGLWHHFWKVLKGYLQICKKSRISVFWLGKSSFERDILNLFSVLKSAF